MLKGERDATTSAGRNSNARYSYNVQGQCSPPTSANAQFHHTVCACAVPPHSLRMRSSTAQFAHAQCHHTVCACAAPPHSLRSEIYFSRTCNAARLSSTYRIALERLETFHWLRNSRGCAIHVVAQFMRTKTNICQCTIFLGGTLSRADIHKTTWSSRPLDRRG